MKQIESNNDTIVVWDPLIRIFHWSLVLLFIIAYFSEGNSQELHNYAGYAIGGLLAFRFIWGFVGSHHAKFSNFIVGPAKTRRYLKRLIAADAPRHIGHNPAGAIMIILLIGIIGITVLSGIILIAIDGYGPLASTFVSNWPEDWMEEIHELSTNITIGLIFLHVFGVIFSSLLHKENLAKAMITGIKKHD